MTDLLEGFDPRSATRRAVQRLADLVGIETPSGHADGALAGFDLLRTWLTPLLASPGTVGTEEGTPHLLWEAAERPHVLLLGHIDTVWPLGTLDRRPFTVEGHRASGPGIFDMKAGLVIGAEALAHADPSTVGVLVTADEEIGSPTSRAVIERTAAKYEAVLVLEPSLDGALKTARKGAGLYQLAITGRAAHAGLEPDAGINALSELARLVLQIEGLASASAQTTVTPTVAQAGSAANAVAAHASLDVDVRAWTAQELNRVDTAIRQLEPAHGEATVAVHGGVNRYPMELAQSRALFELASEVARTLELEPLGQAHAGGASDGNFTAALGVPTLDGLGAVGGGAHAEHEWVDVRLLCDRAQLVAGVLRALTGSAR